MLPILEVYLMRKLLLVIAGLVMAVVLSVPRPSAAWTSAGLGTGYAGPYAYPYPFPYAPGGFPYYPAPPYYAPLYYPPVYYPPVYPPGVFWPGYGPDVAVRWNRYFNPPPPQIRGYTLPR